MVKLLVLFLFGLNSCLTWLTRSAEGLEDEEKYESEPFDSWLILHCISWKAWFVLHWPAWLWEWALLICGNTSWALILCSLLALAVESLVEGLIIKLPMSSGDGLANFTSGVWVGRGLGVMEVTSAVKSMGVSCGLRLLGCSVPSVANWDFNFSITSSCHAISALERVRLTFLDF